MKGKDLRIKKGDGGLHVGLWCHVLVVDRKVLEVVGPLLLDNGPAASLVIPGVVHGSLVEDRLAVGVFSPEPVHDCPIGGPGRQREMEGMVVALYHVVCFLFTAKSGLKLIPQGVGKGRLLLQLAS
jgi:hypothetical protein